MKNLNEIQEKLNITFKNSDILKLAFVHRSYLNETKDKSIISNERLEFLGDAVLQFISSSYIYKLVPEFSEGELTNLRARVVNTESLASETSRLDLSQYLYISKGEKEVAKESNYILANLFESIIGAIYLDQGLEACEKFLMTNLFYKISEILSEGRLKDPKSQFQEFSQEKYNITPVYTLLAEEGPDHDKRFTIGVYVDDKLKGTGKGSSKRKAEQSAAQDALDKS